VSPKTMRNSVVPVSVYDLASMCSNAALLSIFSPRNLHSEFLKSQPETPEHETISFTVNAQGGNFVFAPIHSIGELVPWDISVLSPYSLITSASELENVLPTPPDSPHLRPIAHLSHLLTPTLSATSVPTLDITHIGEPSATVIAPIRPRWPQIFVRVMKRSIALTFMFLKTLVHFALGTFFTRRATNKSESVQREDPPSDVQKVLGKIMTLDSSINGGGTSGALAFVFCPNSATVSILVHRHANASFENVSIDIDGSKVTCRVKEIKDGHFLVEFDNIPYGKCVSVSAP
jgi:hypothetical protein